MKMNSPVLLVHKDISCKKLIINLNVKFWILFQIVKNKLKKNILFVSNAHLIILFKIENVYLVIKLKIANIMKMKKFAINVQTGIYSLLIKKNVKKIKLITIVED